MTIALIVVLVIAGFLAYASSRPNELRVERSERIHAAPEKIFPHINDFHQWAAWSPYEKRDPNMKKTYAGSPEGAGAVYEWDGNSQVGKGRMEIIQSVPPNEVRIKLDFVKPFEGHNTAAFIIEPVGDATNVTWSMHGPSSFAHKAMGVFMNMDRMIGGDFEKGLASLKTIAES